MAAFRLDIYMERWAVLYKGIHHTEKEPRFFRCDDEMNLDDLLQKYHKINDPICLIKTNLEGDMNIPRRIDNMKYTCMFMKRVDPNKPKEQADAKYLCKDIAKAFFIKLDKDRQDAARTDRTSPLAALDLAKVRFTTVYPVTSANMVLLICDIECPEYDKVCFTESDYLPEEEADWL